MPDSFAKNQRRRNLKKYVRKLCKAFILRVKKYEKLEQIFDDRNSYFKTDHDATFMHMKEDHIRNGQLKPGYNTQAATTNEYGVDFALYSNPTDFSTILKSNEGCR